MSKPEDEILEKLAQLEAQIIEDSPQALSVPPKQTGLTRESTTVKVEAQGGSVRSDLYLLAGIALIVTGVFLVLNHIKVGTGFLSWVGLAGQGFGLILVPLVLGIGFLFYDYKNKVGWVLTAASLVVILFAMLSHLVMTFPHMSLFGLIIMLLPFAAGGALVAKAVKSQSSTRE